MLAKDNQQQPNTNPLGTEPILHLIGRYAIPTSLTLMVNYLYNIVDQIFVGQGVGIAGMAATNVAFPMTILAIALALLLGDGCAANVSLFLGRKDQETAERIVSHTMTLLVLFGFGIAVLSFFFAPQIVRLFGATETAFRDSLVYLRTTVYHEMYDGGLCHQFGVGPGVYFLVPLGRFWGRICHGAGPGGDGDWLFLVLEKAKNGTGAQSGAAADAGLDATHPLFGHSKPLYPTFDGFGTNHHEQFHEPLWGPDGLWRRHCSLGLWHDDEGLSNCPFHVCGRLFCYPAHPWV